MGKLGYNDKEVGQRVLVTSQAVRQYRLGQRQPRPLVLQRLVDVLQIDPALLSAPLQLAGAHPAGPPQGTEAGSDSPAASGLRVIRIGVCEHWNSAIFASFEPLFLARRIKPIFVPVSSRLEEAHRDMDQKVDVLIHYEYLVSYDRLLKPTNPEQAEPPQFENKYLDLQADFPLFSFRGIHVFGNRERLVEIWRQQGLFTEELGDLLKGKPFLPYDHPDYERLVKAALEHASIDFVKGTHYQIAAERLYEHHDVSLQDRWHDDRSGGGGHDPLSLFREGESDLYVGVNRDWLLLGNTQKGQESRFLILVLPERFDTNPIACLIYKRGNPQLYEGALHDLSSIWFTGIQQILAWTVDIEGLPLLPHSPPQDDPKCDIATVIAMSHLGATTRITNRLTGNFKVPLEGDGLRDWFTRMDKHHVFYPSLVEAQAQQKMPANTRYLERMAVILQKYRPKQNWEKRAQEYR